MSRQLNQARARWVWQAARRRSRTQPRAQVGLGDSGTFIAAFLAPMVVMAGLVMLGSRTPRRRAR